MAEEDYDVSTLELNETSTPVTDEELAELSELHPERFENSHGQRLLHREKERRCLELAKAGVTYEVIAQQVGYADSGGAWKAAQRALKRIPQEEAEDFRVIQLQRLNGMLLVLWPKVQDPSHAEHFAAMDRASRLIDQMNKLRGIEMAPEQTVNHNVSGAVLTIDGTKDEYIAGLKQIAGVPNALTKATEVQDVEFTETTQTQAPATVASPARHWGQNLPNASDDDRHIPIHDPQGDQPLLGFPTIEGED